MRIRQLFWVILAVGCDSPGVRVRLADIPPPATFAELRVMYDTARLTTCAMDPVVAGENWKTIALPDEGLRLRLSREWQHKPVRDTIVVGLDKRVEDVFEGPRKGHIRVLRITSGAIGGRWMARNKRGDPAEGTLCQIENGLAGSIWTLYAPGATWGAPDRSGSRHLAMGDLITPDGTRYWVFVDALSAEERNGLVWTVADAGLASRYPPL